MFGFKKGFRTPKKPSRKQIEENEKIKNFLEAYRAVCKEHALQLVPIIKNLEHGGMEPDFKLAPFIPAPEPKLKGWGEAQKENLATQKNCRHLNEGENCKHCGVRIADQDESGTGVTPEFIAIKEKKIADWEAKEAEHNKDEAVH